MDHIRSCSGRRLTLARSDHATHGTQHFRLPAILLGVGLGGFFDGIVLHQILQWHHMVSHIYTPDTVANLELNTTLDGLFHLATWILTVAGVAALWLEMGRTGVSPRPSALVGGMLAGWGGFNVLEGLVAHQLLGLHHVRPGPDEVLYDVGFLAWGAVMVAVGWWMLRRPGDAEPVL
jgi:uncharacterized membrane protein